MTDQAQTSAQNILDNIISASQDSKFFLSEDVHDQAGNKLLGKGYQVTAEIKDKITNRILKKPLETSISSEPSLTAEDIYKAAESLVDRNPFLQAFTPELKVDLYALKNLEISPLAALLLMVQKNNKADALDHTLFMVLIARLIAKKINFESTQLYDLTIACLLHDIGELYCSIPTSSELSVEHWRSIMTHPIIGSSVVRQHMDYPESVSISILEHHERNDGSGYPNHTPAETLSDMGKLLIVAEAFSGMFKKQYDTNHLITTLKLATHDLPSVPLNALIDLLRNSKAKGVSDETRPILDNLLTQLDNLEECIGSLKILSSEKAELKNISNYLILRLRRICQTIYASGLTEGVELGMWDHMKLEEDINRELYITINEVDWKIKDVFRDLSLRITQDGIKNPDELIKVFDKIKRAE